MKQSMKSEFKNSNLNFSEAFRRTRGGHHCVHLRFDLKPMQFDRIRGLFFELMLASTPSPLTDLAASRKSKKGGTGRGDGPGDSRGRRAPWPSPWQRRCRHRSRPRPCPPLSLVSLRSPSTAAIPGEDPHRRFAPRSRRTRPRRPCQCTHPPSKRSPSRPVLAHAQRVATPSS